MAIRICIFTFKTCKKININYPSGIQSRTKNKTFALDKIENALDFACTINDNYIGSITVEILDYAKRINHRILKEKHFF